MITCCDAPDTPAAYTSAKAESAATASTVKRQITAAVSPLETPHPVNEEEEEEEEEGGLFKADAVNEEDSDEEIVRDLLAR